MPKADMETAGGEVLDEATLKKLKQHNRSIYQQKKQDAVALRQKLELWKEEKKKKKKEAQKLEQKKPFVTTVLKPASRKPLSVPQNKSLPCKSECTATKTMSKVTKCEPAGRPMKPITVKAKQGSRAQASVKGQKAGQKENQQPTGSVRDFPSTTSELSDHGTDSVKTLSGSDCSKLSGSEMITPLFGNRTGLDKGHAITCLAKSTEDGEEVIQVLSLADELQTATSVTNPAVSECIISSTESQHSAMSITDGTSIEFGQNLDKLAQGDISNDALSASQNKNKGAARDSLTSRFRKSQLQSNPAKNCVPAAPKESQHLSNRAALKKTSRKSVHTAKPSIANPNKSILKKKSCTINVRSSGAGTKAVLKGSQSCQTKGKRVASTEDRSVPQADLFAREGQEDKHAAATSSNHVFFAKDAGKAEGEGAGYRKTPGRAKAQDYMREKLNEWIAAKGRTPLSLRHAACFHGEGDGRQQHTPRSQIKASMSVEQLSKQEKTLTKEDQLNTRKRLTWTNRKYAPLPPRSAPSSAVKTASTNRLAHDSVKLSMKNKKPDTGAIHQGRQESVKTASSKSHENTNFESKESAQDAVERESSPRVEGSQSPRMAEGNARLSLDVTTTGHLYIEYQKCLTALESGLLDTDGVLQWLNMVSEASQEARHHADYYKCQVAALKQLGDEDALLAAFEQAIIHNAQPAEEMAHLLTATMKELLSDQSAQHSRGAKSSTTKRPMGSKRGSHSCGPVVYLPEVEMENMFESTTVKFSVREVTPFKKRRRVTDMDEKLVSVITPVRRSARFASIKATAPPSEGRLPVGTPHMMEYSTLEEVPSAEKEHMLFQPNRALDSLFKEVSPVLESTASLEVDIQVSAETEKPVSSEEERLSLDVTQVSVEKTDRN